MSTETTNKKIKIDNGTTFGRAYTDKAVDELLKGVGGSDIGIIELTDNQVQTLNADNTITFTSEQIAIIKKSIGISFVYGGQELGRGTVSFWVQGSTSLYQINATLLNNFFVIPFTNESALSQLNLIKYNYLYNPQFVIGTSSIKLFDPDGDYNSNYVFIDEINGNSIIHDVEGQVVNHSFTEDKPISLFGKHSILVPKDSTDANIDLYVHNIVLKDNAETTTKKIYLTIQSTTNTKATTKKLLTTLLGSTARYIRVSGYTATNDISAINWTGTFDTSKYDVRGTETLLTDFAVIEDSVVTLK